MRAPNQRICTERVPRPCPALITLSLCVYVAALAPAQARSDKSASETVEIQSKAVGRTLKYRVLLPNGYESGTERYPAVYLLHGLGGSYVSFAE